MDLARAPTPIEHLRRLSARVGAEVFVKRDDLTGTDLTGCRSILFRHTGGIFGPMPRGREVTAP